MLKETFVLCAMAVLSTAAQANLFTATDGSASADITAAPNGPNTDVTIVLKNLTSAASTHSAGNLLTGLNFAGVGTMALFSQTGPQQFVFSTGTTGALSGGGPFDPSWAVVSGDLYFDGFGSGGKPIIGPAATSDTTYANANASLTSGPHGTYIYKEATFVLTAPGAFDANALANVTFLFNTDGSIEVPGDGGSGGGIPEPASLGILGIGAAALLSRRSRK